MNNEQLLNILTKKEFSDPESEIDISDVDISEYLDDLFKEDE